MQYKESSKDYSDHTVQITLDVPCDLLAQVDLLLQNSPVITTREEALVSAMCFALNENDCEF